MFLSIESAQQGMYVLDLDSRPIYYTVLKNQRRSSIQDF